MRFNFGILIIGTSLILLTSQNCSRRILVAPEDHQITHHSVSHDFTKLRYVATNFPPGSFETSLTVDYDLSRNRVEIASQRLDGVRCTKAFSISPILTTTFQEILHSMSYEPNIQADHLFAGDKFMTLTSPLGEQEFVLDAAVVPSNVAKVKEPQQIYFLIQGLLFTDSIDGVESCLSPDGISI